MDYKKLLPLVLPMVIAAATLLALGLRRGNALVSQRFQLGDELPEDLSKLKAPVMIPKDAPEFYFTRLLYQQNGWRGTRTMPKPPQYTCPEFGGGNFFPPQGWGWATDYPGADCKFMGGVHRLTGLRVYPHPNVVAIMDPDLFKYPYVYIVEAGQMYLSDEEAARLRAFLLRGGFLHVDDFWGGFQKSNFEEQIRKVFPDREMQPVPMTHQVFHTFYDVDAVMQTPNGGNGCRGGRTWEQADDTEPKIYGISDDTGRLMVMVTYNTDLGDAWEFMDLPCYPEKFSGYAYRVGIDFMIYAMTH